MSSKHESRTIRRGKGRAAVAMFAAVAGLVLAGAPAATAAPASTAPIDLVDPGSGSSFHGTAAFSNRSVTVAGTFHAVGCRRFYAAPHAGSKQLDIKSTSLHCNSTTQENMPLAANVVGGANFVRVALTDANGVGVGKDIYRP
ncbi:hypothetical protein ACWEHA_05270 [Amycolatopsis nivea]